MKLNKLISIAFCLVLIIAVLSVVSFAADPITGQVDANNIKWTLTERSGDTGYYDLKIEPIDAEKDAAIPYAADGASAWTKGDVAQDKIKTVTLVGIKSIGGSAFRAHTAIESVDFGDTCESIGSYAFQNGLTKLTTITGMDAVKEIKDNVFNGCTSLATIPYMPALETIGAQAFASTTETDITLPGTLKSIADNGFANSKIAKVTFEGGNANLSIGNNAFGATAKAEIIFESDMTALTFGGALNWNTNWTGDNLYKIRIPAGCTVVEAAVKNHLNTDYTAFVEGAGKVVYEVIPAAGTKTLYQNTSGTEALSDFYYYTTGSTMYIEPRFIGRGNVMLDYIGKLSGVSYVIADNFWSNTTATKLVVKEGIKNIPNAVFNGNKTIAEIDFADSVEIIGAYTFNVGSVTNLKLTKGRLPKNLKVVRNVAFNNRRLDVGGDTLVIPASVTDIQEQAFNNTGGNYSILRFEPSENAVKISGTYAFGNNTSLKNVFLPANVEVVKDAFSGTALTTVVFQGNVPANWSALANTDSPFYTGNAKTAYIQADATGFDETMKTKMSGWGFNTINTASDIVVTKSQNDTAKTM